MQAELIETNELVKVVETSGLEKTKGQKLLEMFTPYFNRMAEIETKIHAINSDDPQKEDIKMAREIRLALKNNRVAAEKVKDDSKASILIEGRLIDNLNNIVKNTSKVLELQCEAIEKAAEIKETARVEALRAERAEKLSPYVEDANIFPLGTMTEEQFNTMLEGYKLALQQKKEAEARAEAERLEKEAAEKLEQERIRQENARLKAEAEEKEKQLAAERAEQARLLAEQKAEAERLAKIEADKKVAELKAQQEAARKLKEEADAKLEAQRKETERLQAELKAKAEAEEAERKRIAAEQAAKLEAEKKAAKAPDKDKLLSTINGFSIPVFPALKSAEATETAQAICEKFAAFKKWALQQIEAL